MGSLLYGNRNETIYEQAQELANQKNKKLSFDTNDFDVSFIRGLNLEMGLPLQILLRV